GGWMLIEAFVYERTVPGYPSLIVGLMVIGGVQLLMIGVMGEYIGKILSEIKARPVYFVAEHSVKAADDDANRAAAEEPRGGAAHLARRRRLRPLARGERRDPRPRRTRPPQRHLGDGGGAGLRSRRGAVARRTRGRRAADRDRTACHADGAVPATHPRLRAVACGVLPAARAPDGARFPRTAR